MFKFHGESDHTLDDKGRVIIPVKYRDALAEGLFLTRGLEGCLWLFQSSKWEQISTLLEESQSVKRNARHLDRLLYSGTEGPLDRQGRLLIPEGLREHAALDDNRVVIVGVKNRVEIWSPKRWSVIAALLADEEAEFAEQLAGFGL
jgi:MraZ protein